MQQCFFFFCSIQHIILSPWEFFLSSDLKVLFLFCWNHLFSKRDLVKLSFTFDQIYQIEQRFIFRKRPQIIVITTVSKGSSHNDNFFSSQCWVFLGYLYSIETLRLNILGRLDVYWKFTVEYSRGTLFVLNIYLWLNIFRRLDVYWALLSKVSPPLSKDSPRQPTEKRKKAVSQSYNEVWKIYRAIRAHYHP